MDNIFQEMTTIRRLSISNMRAILRNIYHKDLMDKLEKLSIKEILKIYEPSPEKYLKTHTLNFINWVHNYDKFLQRKEKYKDNPEKLKEIEKEIEENKEPKPPIEEEKEEEGEQVPEASSCGGFLGWLKCAIDDL